MLYFFFQNLPKLPIVASFKGKRMVLIVLMVLYIIIL